MICDYCKSDMLYLKETENKTGLYCKNCGRWLKWVDPDEKIRVEQILDKQRREVRIDGNDVERVLENYRACKAKYKEMSDELQFFKESNAGKLNKMVLDAIYEKALKLKELGVKVSTYEEVLKALRLK